MKRALPIAVAALFGVLLIWVGTASAWGGQYCRDHPNKPGCQPGASVAHTTIAATTTVPAPTPAPAVASTTTPVSTSEGSAPTTGAGTPSSVLARQELAATGDDYTSLLYLGAVLCTLGWVVLYMRRRADG